jgi:hypothetical protein
MLSENFFLKIVVYLEWSICRPVTRRTAVGSSKEENSLQSASSSEAVEFDKLFFQGGLEHPPECIAVKPCHFTCFLSKRSDHSYTIIEETANT